MSRWSILSNSAFSRLRGYVWITINRLWIMHIFTYERDPQDQVILGGGGGCFSCYISGCVSPPFYECLRWVYRFCFPLWNFGWVLNWVLMCQWFSAGSCGSVCQTVWDNMPIYRIGMRARILGSTNMPIAYTIAVGTWGRICAIPNK